MLEADDMDEFKVWAAEGLENEQSLNLQQKGEAAHFWS